MKWYEREERELVEALNNYELTVKEFNQKMYDLMSDVEKREKESADKAFKDYMRR